MTPCDWSPQGEKAAAAYPLGPRHTPALHKSPPRFLKGGNDMGEGYHPVRYPDPGPARDPVSPTLRRETAKADGNTTSSPPTRLELDALLAEQQRRDQLL